MARSLVLVSCALAVACAADPVVSPDGGAPADALASAADASAADASADDAAADDASAPSCEAPAHMPACDEALCFVPAGCFAMGSPTDEPCRDSTEVQHEVRLTHDFLLSRREVSRAELRTALGYEAYGVLVDHPGTEITWHEVAAYANALSDRDGFARCFDCTGVDRDVRCTPSPAYAASIYDCPGYRHPTEAEWEYAYRAGTTTTFYAGTLTATCTADPIADAIAWYGPTSQGALHSPGGRPANAWGLEDMAGNAFEWTFDRAAPLTADAAIDPARPLMDPDGEAIMRSGDWGTEARFVRAASRVPFPASIPLFSLGARVARSLPPAAARPSGDRDGGVADGAVPEACSPSVVAAPIQIPAGPRVHVQVSFAGQEQLLLVDTGSPFTTFYLSPDAPGLAPGVGLVTIGCMQVPFYGRNVRAGQVVRGLPVLGAIGNDWLLSAPTAIDLGAATLTRWASAGEVPDRATLVRLPITRSQDRLLVAARIDGTDVRLLLDTGTPRTLWIGPTGAATDRLITLVGEGGDQWPVREGTGSVELAGEMPVDQLIWRAPMLGTLETFLRGLGPDVVGILGLASFGTRRVYFGVEDDAVLLGPP